MGFKRPFQRPGPRSSSIWEYLCHDPGYCSPARRAGMGKPLKSEIRGLQICGITYYRTKYLTTCDYKSLFTSFKSPPSLRVSLIAQLPQRAVGIATPVYISPAQQILYG